MNEPSKCGEGFPADVFAVDDLKQGAVLLHVLGAIYAVIGLTLVYTEYYVPALVVLKEKLSVRSDDVAGALILALGRAIPGFLTAVVGAFVTSSLEAKPSSLIGPAVWNILIVIAVCSFETAGGRVLELNGWAFHRDSIFHSTCLALILVFSMDGRIVIYEAVILLLMYFAYVLLVSTRKIEDLLRSACKRPASQTENTPANAEEKANDIGDAWDMDQEGNVQTVSKDYILSEPVSLAYPKGRGCWKVFTYLATLPILVPLYFTLPDVKKGSWRKLFPVTIVVSVVWICLLAYLAVWWLSVATCVFGVPPALSGILVGLVFSIPDIAVFVMIAKSGRPDLAVSSSFGLNVVNITIAMAIPWLISMAVNGDSSLYAMSSGVVCSAVLMWLVLITVFFCALAFRWRLRKGFGFAAILTYVLFIAVSLTFSYGYVQCPM